MKKWQEYGTTLIGIILLYIFLIVLMAVGLVNGYHQGVLVLIGINVIAATSLNLATGYLGQLALGHAGFMAIGAYTAALFMQMIKVINLPVDIALVAALIVGGLMAAFFGVIIGIPALRLRGDYLGIVTLGFGEIIKNAIFNLDFTGGARGYRGYLGSINLTKMYIIVAIVLTVLFLLIRSRHGRAMISIKEDEIAAEAVGVPTTFYKIFGFATSAFFAGIAGGTLAFYQKMIDPKKFTFMYSVEIFIIVVLGGMGSITGTVVAAVILGVLNEFLHVIDQWRLVIYSILLVIMMIFRPEGLMGSKEFSFVGLVKWLLKKMNKSSVGDDKDSASLEVK